jgi:S-formylglutathione hydrolase
LLQLLNLLQQVGHSEAFKKYIGPNKKDWEKYDSVALIRDGFYFPEILVDQGEADSFLNEGLRPWLLEEHVGQSGVDLKVSVCNQWL